MSRKRATQNIQLATVDDLFGLEESPNGIVQVQLEDLLEFENHPFKVIRDDEAMQELADSIQKNGVLSPLEVRVHSVVAGKYEVIAGHRRKCAAELAGLPEVPCILVDVEDDTAILRMVDSNLYRPSILPSEKAFAYKMRLEAMKRQGKRSDLTSAQLGQKLEKKTSKDELAEKVGESRNQIQRYIRLTYLTESLLDMVDGKKIPFNVGVSLSYLKAEPQGWLYDFMESRGNSPTIVQAEKFRKYQEDGKLTKEVMEVILCEDNTSSSAVSFKPKTLQKYFPSGTSKQEMEETILKLLDNWKSK